MNWDIGILNSTLVNLLPTAVQAGTVSGTGVDITDFDGIGIALLDVAAGGTANCDVKLMDCDTVGGTYVDVPGAVFTQVTTGASQQKIKVDLAVARRFLRATATQTGSHTFSVNLIGRKQYT